jgi:hypothetical protein
MLGNIVKSVLLVLIAVMLFSAVACGLSSPFKETQIRVVEAPLEVVGIDINKRWEGRNVTGIDIICTLTNNGPSEKFKVAAEISSPAFRKKSLTVHFSENATESITFSFDMKGIDVPKGDFEVRAGCRPGPSD